MVNRPLSDYQDTLSKEPAYFASSLNTEYTGRWPTGAFMGHGGSLITDNVKWTGDCFILKQVVAGGRPSVGSKSNLGWEASPGNLSFTTLEVGERREATA